MNKNSKSALFLISVILFFAFSFSGCSNLFDTFINEDGSYKTGNTDTTAGGSADNTSGGLVVIKNGGKTNLIKYDPEVKVYNIGRKSLSDTSTDFSNGTEVNIGAQDNPVDFKIYLQSKYAVAKWTAVQTHHLASSANDILNLDYAENSTAENIPFTEIADGIRCEIPFGRSIVKVQITSDDGFYTNEYSIVFNRFINPDYSLSVKANKEIDSPSVIERLSDFNVNISEYSENEEIRTVKYQNGFFDHNPFTFAVNGDRQGSCKWSFEHKKVYGYQNNDAILREPDESLGDITENIPVSKIDEHTVQASLPFGVIQAKAVLEYSDNMGFSISKTYFVSLTRVKKFNTVNSGLVVFTSLHPETNLITYEKDQHEYSVGKEFAGDLSSDTKYENGTTIQISNNDNPVHFKIEKIMEGKTANVTWNFEQISTLDSKNPANYKKNSSPKPVEFTPAGNDNKFSEVQSQIPFGHTKVTVTVDYGDKNNVFTYYINLYRTVNLQYTLKVLAKGEYENRVQELTGGKITDYSKKSYTAKTLEWDSAWSKSTGDAAYNPVLYEASDDSQIAQALWTFKKTLTYDYKNNKEVLRPANDGEEFEKVSFEKVTGNNCAVNTMLPPGKILAEVKIVYRDNMDFEFEKNHTVEIIREKKVSDSIGLSVRTSGTAAKELISFDKTQFSYTVGKNQKEDTGAESSYKNGSIINISRNENPVKFSLNPEISAKNVEWKVELTGTLDTKTDSDGNLSDPQKYTNLKTAQDITDKPGICTKSTDGKTAEIDIPYGTVKVTVKFHSDEYKSTENSNYDSEYSVIINRCIIPDYEISVKPANDEKSYSRESEEEPVVETNYKKQEKFTDKFTFGKNAYEAYGKDGTETLCWDNGNKINTAVILKFKPEDDAFKVKEECKKTQTFKGDGTLRDPVKNETWSPVAVTENKDSTFTIELPYGKTRAYSTVIYKDCLNEYALKYSVDMIRKWENSILVDVTPENGEGDGDGDGEGGSKNPSEKDEQISYDIENLAGNIPEGFKIKYETDSNGKPVLDENGNFVPEFDYANKWGNVKVHNYKLLVAGGSSYVLLTYVDASGEEIITRIDMNLSTYNDTSLGTLKYSAKYSNGCTGYAMNAGSTESEKDWNRGYSPAAQNVKPGIILGSTFETFSYNDAEVKKGTHYSGEWKSSSFPAPVLDSDGNFTSEDGSYSVYAMADSRADIESFTFEAAANKPYASIQYFIGDTNPDTVTINKSEKIGVIEASDKWSDSVSDASVKGAINLNNDNALSSTTLWIKVTTKEYKHSTRQDESVNDIYADTAYHRVIFTKPGAGNTGLIEYFHNFGYQNQYDNTSAVRRYWESVPFRFAPNGSNSIPDIKYELGSGKDGFVTYCAAQGYYEDSVNIYFRPKDKDAKVEVQVIGLETLPYINGTVEEDTAWDGKTITGESVANTSSGNWMYLSGADIRANYPNAKCSKKVELTQKVKFVRGTYIDPYSARATEQKYDGYNVVIGNVDQNNTDTDSDLSDTGTIVYIFINGKPYRYDFAKTPSNVNSLYSTGIWSAMGDTASSEYNINGVTTTVRIPDTEKEGRFYMWKLRPDQTIETVKAVYTEYQEAQLGISGGNFEDSKKPGFTVAMSDGNTYPVTDLLTAGNSQYKLITKTQQEDKAWHETKVYPAVNYGENNKLKAGTYYFEFKIWDKDNSSSTTKNAVLVVVDNGSTQLGNIKIGGYNETRYSNIWNKRFGPTTDFSGNDFIYTASYVSRNYSYLEFKTLVEDAEVTLTKQHTNMVVLRDSTGPYYLKDGIKKYLKTKSDFETAESDLAWSVAEEVPATTVSGMQKTAIVDSKQGAELYTFTVHNKNNSNGQGGIPLDRVYKVFSYPEYFGNCGLSNISAYQYGTGSDANNERFNRKIYDNSDASGANASNPDKFAVDMNYNGELVISLVKNTGNNGNERDRSQDFATQKLYKPSLVVLDKDGAPLVNADTGIVYSSTKETDNEYTITIPNEVYMSELWRGGKLKLKVRTISERGLAKIAGGIQWGGAESEEALGSDKRDYEMIINIPSFIPQPVKEETFVITSLNGHKYHTVDFDKIGTEYQHQIAYRFGSNRSDSTDKKFYERFGGLEVVASTDKGASWIVSSFNCSGWIYVVQIDGVDYWATLNENGTTKPDWKITKDGSNVTYEYSGRLTPLDVTASQWTDGSKDYGYENDSAGNISFNPDVELQIIPKLVYGISEGGEPVPYIQIEHKVLNSNGHTIKIGAVMDTLIARTDIAFDAGAVLAANADKPDIVEKNYGFDMVNKYNGNTITFSVIYKNAYGVDAVDKAWYGEYKNEYKEEYLWGSDPSEGRYDDSAVNYSYTNGGAGYTDKEITKSLRMTVTTQ